MIAITAVIALIVAVGVVGVLTTSDDGDGGDDSVETSEAATETQTPTATEEPSPSPTETATPTATVESTPTQTASPTPTEAPDTEGTIDDPLPVGDPVLSRFTYSDTFGTTEWEGIVEGLIEVGPGQFNDSPGRCLVLVGTASPVAIEEGVATNGFDTPDFALLADGQLIDGTVNECDTTGLEAAGYGWILNAAVTEGTAYNFYEEFFLPDPAPEVEVVVAGDPRSDESLFYEPTVIGAPPPADTTVGQSVAEGREVLPVGDPVLSQFTYTEQFGATDWEGVVFGLVERGPGQFNDSPGRCVVLLGTITPTSIDEGVTTSGFDTPNFDLIAGGHLVDGAVNECDTSELEAIGYDWILNAEVTEGTTYAFYQEFFLPDPPRTLEVVVGGDASGEEHVLFESTILESVPTP